MKQLYFIVLVSFFLVSCQEKVTLDSLSKINGYWEIQKVQFPDGQKKEYSINETVEYFNWQDSRGFRKKVIPQYDGTFITNDEFEAFQIKDSSGIFQIHYQTDFARWSETILTLTDSVLVLGNKQHFRYHYKRFQPISLQ